MSEHTGLGQRPPRTFNITVASNTGALELKFGGNCIGYSIIAPSAAAAYAIKFEMDSFPLDKKEGLVGDNVRWNEFQMYYDNARDKGVTCTIYNATDGSYRVRAWYKA
jgi:hypothetical protein